ncbi:MAG: hypothetical protein KF739_04595 [Cryobacterium sp.]|nr:hypothetical protein [Cryobacterium sp.]
MSDEQTEEEDDFELTPEQAKRYAPLLDEFRQAVDEDPLMLELFAKAHWNHQEMLARVEAKTSRSK